MNPMRFVIVRTDNGYHVRYVSSRNHEIVLWSEDYSSLPAAQRAIQLTKLHARTAPVVGPLDLRQSA